MVSTPSLDGLNDIALIRAESNIANKVCLTRLGVTYHEFVVGVKSDGNGGSVPIGITPEQRRDIEGLIFSSLYQTPEYRKHITDRNQNGG